MAVAWELFRWGPWICGWRQGACLCNGVRAVEGRLRICGAGSSLPVSGWSSQLDPGVRGHKGWAWDQLLAEGKAP